MTTSDKIIGLPEGGEPGKGFEFPGVFEITALGPASANLDSEIPRLLTAAGLNVLHETVSMRPSSAGRFVSVTLSFRAESRADYDAAHEALRAHPEVKWTI
jgi:putative lipoic acid-binding regulatory protein